MPKDGVEAVQVTYSGGYRVTEYDEHIYYIKEGGIGAIIPLFRMPTEGGVETEVVSSISSDSRIVVTAKGVYFLAPGAKAIQLLDHATGKVSIVATLEKEGLFLSVSPEDAYIIWTQEDKNTTDLMLVEDFR